MTAAAAAAGEEQQQAQQQQPLGAVGAFSGLSQVQQPGAAAAAGKAAQAVKEAAAGLTEDQRWDVAVDVVADLGDPQTAARIRAERNNWYRLQRVMQVGTVTNCQMVMPQHLAT